MSRSGKVLWLTLAVAVLMLPACRSKPLALNTDIDLKAILPPSLEVFHIQRLDPATGIQPQWLVLYKYDITDRFSPIAGVVYRADRGGSNKPPAIFPYPLTLPDRDYLGSANVSVRAADVLSKKSGVELVVENKDANGFVTEAAIFHWHDPFPDEVWRAHSLEERYYECMGFFRTDGQIRVEVDRVVVQELVGDRSQLARLYEYRPNSEGLYLLPDGVTLTSVGKTWVDFAFGQTGSVLNSPYPEKIVLAFYKSLGGPVEKLEAYLSRDGQKLLSGGLTGYGCNWPPGQVKQALVHEITYFPGVESQVEDVESRQALVELKVQCESQGGETMFQDVHVGWFLKREEGLWKMDRIYRPGS